MASNVLEMSGGSDSDQAYSSAPEDTPSNILPPDYDGLPQTGPKGVLTDYYRKQETERRKEILAQEKRQEIIEKHSATVKSYSEENNGSVPEGDTDDKAMTNLALALEGGTLQEDPFLNEYRAKRLEEMKREAQKGGKRQRFGNLVELRGDKYNECIDNTLPQTIVIMHIYEEVQPMCIYMNQKLAQLAKLYPTARMCRVRAHTLGLSDEFINEGLPALLVYKDGKMIANMVKVYTVIGEYGYSTEDLESFLQKTKCLPPESEREDGPLLPKSIASARKRLPSSSDSD